MSDIYALTVGRNEEHRYLESFLENVSEWADEHFFYDDQSDDETAYIASQWATVRVRPDTRPSFNSDEGSYRWGAWMQFEDTMQPREGDWVFVIDCDEMVVGKSDRTVRESIERVCEAAIYGAVSIAFNEVFGFTRDGVPLIRMDGFWGQGFAPRLFTYQSGATFAPGKVGVPAVPSYVMADRNNWRNTDEISVMHFGYANAADLQTKFKRYNGVPGHHPDHIASILTPPALVPWGGPHGEMVYAGDS
jgi:Glycosyl transferase family 2